MSLVTGANGQVGQELQFLSTQFSDFEFFFANREILDISDEMAINALFETMNFKYCINCAAYTAVDKAEGNLELADAVNHQAVANLAKIAVAKTIRLIHISTDYVFDGTNHQPYTESDTTNPQSVYGVTKLAGEKAMLTANPPNSIIIRTSWVYSNFGNNFVKTMLRLSQEKDQLGIIVDQIGTPTYAEDLAKSILAILPQLNAQTVEIYNYSNEGVCSWYDFAKAIFEIKGIAIKVKPIESTEYPTPAKRPFYSVLNKRKIKDHFELVIPNWKEALKHSLKQ